jgi:hypothetical protein
VPTYVFETTTDSIFTLYRRTRSQKRKKD